MGAILVDLVKIGAIGASLAFLYLSYNLLRKEISLKDSTGSPLPARSENLAAIRNFRWAALAFLLVGVTAEFLFAQAPPLISAWQRKFFGNELVRVRFTNWEYLPEKQRLAFGIEENRVRSNIYVLPEQTNDYMVYVGVRRKTEAPPDQGEYDLVFGPYPISNQGRVEKVLSQAQLDKLGQHCIEFSAFGLEKKDSNNSAVSLPLKPAAVMNKVFNTATACLPEP